MLAAWTATSPVCAVRVTSFPAETVEATVVVRESLDLSMRERMNPALSSLRLRVELSAPSQEG
jgi:hypothetical protein